MQRTKSYIATLMGLRMHVIIEVDEVRWSALVFAHADPTRLMLATPGRNEGYDRRCVVRYPDRSGRNPVKNHGKLADTPKVSIMTDKIRSYEAVERITSEFEPVEDKFDAPSGFGSFARDIADWVSGNSANMGVRYTDVFHATNCRQLGQFVFTLRSSHTTVGGVDMTEHWETVEAKIHEGLLENAQFMGEPDREHLKKVADHIVDGYLIEQIFYGAKAEQIAAESRCKALGDTYVAESAIVADMTGYDDPEAAGIDVYFPKTDTTAQVKRGTGGEMEDDCEADILMRLIEPDEDENDLVHPEVREYEI